MPGVGNLTQATYATKRISFERKPLIFKVKRNTSGALRGPSTRRTLDSCFTKGS